MGEASTQAFRFRWEQRLRDCQDLDGTTAGVLLWLATYGDRDGGSCFPSKETLAAASKRALSTVEDCLHKARAAGWVTWEHRPGQGRVNHYQLQIPAHLATLTGQPGTPRRAGDRPSKPPIGTHQSPGERGVYPPAPTRLPTQDQNKTSGGTMNESDPQAQHSVERELREAALEPTSPRAQRAMRQAHRLGMSPEAIADAMRVGSVDYVNDVLKGS